MQRRKHRNIERGDSRTDARLAVVPGSSDATTLFFVPSAARSGIWLAASIPERLLKCL